MRSSAILLMNKTNTLSGADPIVLAIDDDRIVLHLIRAILTKHNYVVKTASSGEEALTTLREITPVVLILDVMMPGISGYDLCSLVKQEDRLKDIPVIFLTSRDMPKDYKAGLDVGAVIYMVKPVKPEQLLHMVQMLSSRTAQ
jgi:DNA-binding response OmpR family regulator